MRAKLIGSGLLAALLLSACGAGTVPSPSPSPCASPTEQAVESQDPDAPGRSASSGTTCVGGAGGQPGAGGPGGGNAGGGQSGPGSSTGPGGPGAGAGGGGGGVGGGGANTVTRTWSETVEVLGDGTHSVIHQEYSAVVQLTLTGEDGSWTFTGSASITAAYASNYSGRKADILGAPCDVHYTDDASASGTVQVDGGLTAYDGFYDFYVSIPGIDTGTNNAVRNDSDCDGPNDLSTTPWAAAPTTASGSGEYSGTSISGSVSTPRTGGDDTITWSFALPN